MRAPNREPDGPQCGRCGRPLDPEHPEHGCDRCISAAEDRRDHHPREGEGEVELPDARL